MALLGHDLDETALTAAARALGSLLRGGELLLLDGAMGAGKTTFTRALAEGLGVDRPERVTSPTFALCLIHPGPRTLVHIDLYRRGEADDVQRSGHTGGAGAAALGLDSGELAGPDRILAVEWAEYWISPPEDHLRIAIVRPPGVAASRTLEATAAGPGAADLLDRWIAAIRRETAV
jgi:tRNA threonylcarbamoyladenosine biosynthesis protein TsaE